jgi:hypothetical protein
MEQPKTLAHRRGALDVELGNVLAQQLVEGCSVELVRLARDRPVGGEAADEASVALRRGAGAETEQRPVRVAVKRRQHGQRLEVRLQARALAVVFGQFTGEHPPQPAGLARREPKDTQMKLVVSDHVDEIAPPNNSARGAEVSRPAGCGRFLHVQVAQLAEIEWRKFLRLRALAAHGRSMPA